MEKEMMKETGNDSDNLSTLIRHPLSLLDEMEKMFQPARWRMKPYQKEWSEISALSEQRMPSIDMIDYDDHVLVHAELPGIDKKDINVSMTDKSVTLTGTSCKETKEEKGDYYCHEISSGSFSRTMAFPSFVDDTKATASFKDGVLELSIPKLEKSTRRNIKID